MDFTLPPPSDQTSNQSILTKIVGFSVIASLLQGFLTGRPVSGADNAGNYLSNTVYLFLLGTIIESGRRFYQWLSHRFQFQYSISAQFTEGDPTYEWILHFLTEHQVWKRSRDFRVSATNSSRKWAATISGQGSGNDVITLSASEGKSSKTSPRLGNAEYVPTYEAPQLFRWNGYWVEIKRTKGLPMYQPGIGAQSIATLYITIFTRDMKVLPHLVDVAKELYMSSSRPHVIVHSVTQNSLTMAGQFNWNNTKRKARRPLCSIILPEGKMNELVKDARDFLTMESWYAQAGIPHRRGYLLYGPPGTGKSSTIYGLAGELGLEIYTVSLASSMVDDAYLQRAADSIPKQSIFLIEDIDCAFPSPRDAEDGEDEDSNAQAAMMMGYPVRGRHMHGGLTRSSVTLSGLLNVLDGVGSEEGRLFFATTNHIDHLDPAFLRPGRIDVRVEYKLATKEQSAALFLRFHPEAYTDIPEEALNEFAQKILPSPPAHPSSEKSASLPHNSGSLKSQYLRYLSTLFASEVPEDEFSTAELQGFLIGCKSLPHTLPHSNLALTQPSLPLEAVHKVPTWIESERAYRRGKAERDARKKDKARAKKEKAEEDKLRGGLARLVGGMAPVPLAGAVSVVPNGTSAAEISSTASDSDEEMSEA